MTLLDQQMPSFRLRQVDRVALAADAARVWPAVRQFDLYELGFVRGLFTLRLLPEFVASRLRGRPLPKIKSARIEDFTAPGTGWMVLAEGEREVVLGFAGRFWQPRIEHVELKPEAFAAFDAPGCGKVAWSLRVDPRRSGGSWVSVDVRVRADEAVWPKFERYWQLIGPFSRAIRRGYLRGLGARFGPAPPAAGLPGDDRLHEVRYQRTHARVIEAPPPKVWPWLVQMGCHRAGWYAIDRLDNGGERSATRVIPELQHIQPGDLLPATPDGPDGFAVLEVRRNEALILGSPDLLPGGKQWGVPWRMTWAFVLEPVGEDATQLLVRVRGAYARASLRGELEAAAMKALHELMQAAQLRHLKQRVEAVV